LALLKNDGGVGEIIFIDSTSSQEKGNLPAEVSKALNAVGALPGAVISDAEGAKVYGTYGHKELVSKDFSRIFRDAKKALKVDIVSGASKAGEAKSDQPTKVAPATSKIAGTEISDASMEEWTSPDGRKMQAKLVRVTKDKLTFVNSAGKSFNLTRTQLDQTSLDKVDAHAAR
jgi:hypothetical protein